MKFYPGHGWQSFSSGSYSPHPFFLPLNRLLRHFPVVPTVAIALIVGTPALALAGSPDGVVADNPTHASAEAAAALQHAPVGSDNRIPPELQGKPWRQITRQITRQIAADRHRVRRAGDGWYADTPRQNYSTRFGPDGPALTVRDGEREHAVGFRFAAVDVDGQSLELDKPEREADGHRLEYRRGTVTEWYVNRSDGLEQGFTVASAPAGRTLRITIDLDSALSARIADTALLLSQNGREIFRYAGLKAWDADGKDLPAAMMLDGDRLALAVQVKNARYPVTVDPVMVNQTAHVTPELPDNPFGGDGDEMGRAVSLDGDRALIGAHASDDEEMTNNGEAFVFERDPGTGDWNFAARLASTDLAGGDGFGLAVSLDGGRALVGTHRDDDNGSDSGSAYVFDFDGTDWNQSAKLVPDDGAANDRFGMTVRLSGNRALVGAPLADDNGSASGSAYVFDFDGASWSQSAKLLPNDGADGEQFGRAVSLSGDRALVGAFIDDDNGDVSGSAYIFDFDGAIWSQSEKLLPGDGEALDRFGRSVSLAGDRALIGASGDDDNGNEAGAAYVFEFDGNAWSQTAKLLASDGADNDQFGHSVSLSSSRALVGSLLDDPNGGNSGSAYVFDFDGTTWNQTSKLVPSDGAAFDEFGRAVSLSGDRALVGAFRDDDNGPDAGSAYVFDNDSGWSQSAKLLPGKAPVDDMFGHAVSVDGNRALIGALFNDENGRNAGAAYVFDFDGANWDQAAMLVANDGTAEGDQFGRSLSLDGDRALIGAINASNNGTDSGAAYVFEFDGASWSQGAKLIANDGASGDQFGWSVSVDGNRALVGARLDDDQGNNSGATYVFDFDGTNWGQSAKLLPSDGAQDDLFGTSVSIHGDRALVGAYLDDDKGDNSGSAYVFDFDGTSWNESNKLLASDGAAGDFFGFSVSLSGDRTLIGAFGDADNGTNSGSVYIFEFDGIAWNPFPKLLPDDGSEADNFGRAVSLSDDRAVVGALRDDDNGVDSGSASVFVFDGTNWVQSAKLLPDDGASGDKFGTSVAISGGRVLAGSPFDDVNGTNSGSAYVFDNGAPMAHDDAIAANEDTLLNGNVMVDNGNSADSDPNGDPVVVTAIDGSGDDVGVELTRASGALLTLDKDGALTYDPNGNFEALGIGESATELFDYTISDGLESGTATVTITINGVNDPPEADDTAATTNEDNAVTITLTGSDIDGDTLTFTVASAPGNGSLGTITQLTPTSAEVTYTPDPDFNGSDSFTFTVNDSTVDSAAASVDITVDPVNDPPEADDTAATTNEDNAVTITLTGSDVDGDALTFAIATGPTDGSLGAITQLTPISAEVTYTPNADFNGIDSFTFTANDGTVDSDPVTVDITIDTVNDAPTLAAADPDTMLEDAGAQVIADWATFDPGPNDESAQSVLNYDVSGVSDPALFAAGPSVDNDGTLRYTLAANANGDSAFDVTVQDDGGTTNGGDDTSAAQSFTITVTPVNDPPTFTPGPDHSVAEGAGAQSVSTWATDISPGPPNESGQALAFNVAGNTNPTLFAAGPAIDASGTLSYTPAPATIGIATITIELEDDGGTDNGGESTSPPESFEIAVIGTADLAIDKTSGTYYTPTGGSLVYTLDVTNAGPSDVTGARVVDNPPARLGGVVWDCAAGGNAGCGATDGTDAIDELIDLPAGDHVTFMLGGALLDNDPLSITNTASVVEPPEIADPDPDNNTDSDTDVVGMYADGFETVEPD